MPTNPRTPVLALLRPHRRRLLAAAVVTLAASGLALVQPAVLQSLVDTAGTHAPPLTLVGVLALAVVAESLCRGAAVYLVMSASESVTLDLRATLAQHALRLPLRRLETTRRGDLVTRLTADTSLVRQVLAAGMIEVASSAVLVVGSLVMMSLIDPRLTVLTGVLIALAIVMITPFARRLRGATGRYQASLGVLGAEFDSALSSIRLVRSYAAEDGRTARIATDARRSWGLGLQVARLSAAVEPVIGIATQGALLAVLLVGGIRVGNGELTLGALVAFLVYLFMVILPTAQLLGALTRIQAGVAALARVDELMQEPTEPQGGLPCAGPGGVVPALELVRASFEYEPGRGLYDVDLVVPSGQHTAIVGPSGSGKSTLLSLLQRLYEPTDGELRVFGDPAALLDARSLRRRIDYVEQNAPALATSLRDNLLLADPGLDDATMLRALARVGLAGAAERGLELTIGDGGIALSGGERQRLAWARLLLSSSDVVLLDEPTSNVDTATESVFDALVQDLLAQRTVVTVSHRLVAVRSAHQIVVVDEGRIVGQGTHSELLDDCPTYRDLVAHDAARLSAAADPPRR